MRDEPSWLSVCHPLHYRRAKYLAKESGILAVGVISSLKDKKIPVRVVCFHNDSLLPKHLSLSIHVVSTGCCTTSKQVCEAAIIGTTTKQQ